MPIVDKTKKAFCQQALKGNRCQIELNTPILNNLTDLTVEDPTPYCNTADSLSVASRTSDTQLLVYLTDYKLVYNIPLVYIKSFKILTNSLSSIPNITQPIKNPYATVREPAGIDPVDITVKQKLKQWVIATLTASPGVIITRTRSSSGVEISYVSLSKRIQLIIPKQSPLSFMNNEVDNTLVDVVDWKNLEWITIPLDSIIAVQTATDTYIQYPELVGRTSTAHVLYELALQQGECFITFEKLDGSTRVMRCSLNEKLTGIKSIAVRTAIDDATDTVNVYDLDANAWRSFKLSKVLSFSTPNISFQNFQISAKPEVVKPVEVKPSVAKRSRIK